MPEINPLTIENLTDAIKSDLIEDVRLTLENPNNKDFVETFFESIRLAITFKYHPLNENQDTSDDMTRLLLSKNCPHPSNYDTIMILMRNLSIDINGKIVNDLLDAGWNYLEDTECLRSDFYNLVRAIAPTNLPQPSENDSEKYKAFYQDLTLIYTLIINTHRMSLDFAFNKNNRQFKLEAFNDERFLPILKHSLQLYSASATYKNISQMIVKMLPKHITADQVNVTEGHIQETMLDCDNFSNALIPDVIHDITTQHKIKAFTLNTSFRHDILSHNESLLCDGKRIYLIDRSGAQESGIHVYDITQPGKLEDALNYLKNNIVTHQYLYHDFLEILGGKLVTYLPMQAQKEGTCSWAATKAIYLAACFAHYNALLHDATLSSEIAKLIYKSFTTYDRIIGIGELIALDIQEPYILSIILQKVIHYQKTRAKFLSEDDHQLLSTYKKDLKSNIESLTTAIEFKILDKILLAIKNNEAAELEQLLSDHPTLINRSNKDGLTPLTYACAFKHGDTLLRMLLNHGADINLPNLRKMTSLIVAIVGGAIHSVEILLAEEVKTEIEFSGASPLAMAIYQDNQNNTEDTPLTDLILEASTSYTKNEVVLSLLNLKVTELPTAKRISILKKLFENGIDPDFNRDAYNGSILHIAYRNDAPLELLRYLATIVSVYEKNNKSQTLLDLAKLDGKEELAQQLREGESVISVYEHKDWDEFNRRLQNIEEISKQFVRDKTILHAMIGRNDVANLRLLMQKQVHPDLTSDYQYSTTPLQFFVRQYLINSNYFSPELAEILLDAGAKPLKNTSFVVQANGFLKMHAYYLLHEMIRDKIELQTIKVFIRAGADPTFASYPETQTPLELAKDLGRDEVVEYLKSEVKAKSTYTLSC